MDTPQPAAPNSQNNHGFQRLLTDAVFIAGATALAYFASFLYEWGYCYRFDIPVTLITPNASSILVAAGALGSALLTFVVLLPLIAPLAAKRERPWVEFVSTIIVLLAFVLVPVALIYGPASRVMLHMAIAGVVVLTIKMLPAYIRHRHLPQGERFDAALKATETPPFGLERLWSAIPNERFKEAATGALFLLCSAWILGNGSAHSQIRYLTLQDKPDAAVLRSYGDTMIVAGFSRDTKMLTGELSLHSISKAAPVHFKTEALGPLLPKTK